MEKNNENDIRTYERPEAEIMVFLILVGFAGVPKMVNLEEAMIRGNEE